MERMTGSSYNDDSATSSESRAIEQFIILSKTACGRACVALIEQIISHPKIFVFGELLEAPTIKALSLESQSSSASSETDGIPHYVAYNTLKLFAYGTYQDYLKDNGEYLYLNDVQTKKLRQLSLVSAAKESNILHYEALKKELGIQNTQELEELIISSIYNGLLVAKLDPALSQVVVTATVGRDIPFSELDSLMQVLDSWCNNSDAIFQEIDRKVKLANDNAAAEVQRKQDLDSLIDDAKRNLRFSDSKYRGGKSSASRNSSSLD